MCLIPGDVAAQATDDIVLTFGIALDPTGGLDPFDAFLNDQADFYCKGKIDAGAQMVSAPPISNKDETDLGFTVTETVPLTSRFHPVSIELWDSDDGDPTGDDQADINPATGKKSLDLLFDACTFTWTGDLVGGNGPRTVRGAGDGDIGELTFDIGTASNRPFSPDDVAIRAAFPVQVTFDDEYVVAGKATTIRVWLTSSYAGPRNGSVTVTARDSVGNVFTETRNVTVPPEGTVIYMFDGTGGPTPFTPLGTPNLSQFCWDVTTDFGIEGPPGGLPVGFENCYGLNNNVVNHCRRMAFIDNPTVVYMPYDWTAGGGPVPPGAGAMATTFASSEPFRLATSPVPFVDSSVAPAPLIDTTVADFGEPWVSMVEMAPLVMASGIDRLVLTPPNGWFAANIAEFPYLPASVIGLSLGEFFPRVVIAEAGFSEVSTHEVGHTYRLSRRSCTTGGIWEELFDLGCRDEYNHTSPPSPYPASGFDVLGNIYPFGNAPTTPGTREVNTTNIMGSTSAPVGSHNLWIDALSYNHLIQDMHLGGGPLVPLLTGGASPDELDAGEEHAVAAVVAPATVAITTGGWIQAINGINTDPPAFAALMLPSFLVESSISGFDLPEAPVGGTSGTGPFAIRFVTPQGVRTYRFLPAVRPPELASPMDGGPYAMALPWDPNTTRIELMGPTNFYHLGQNQDMLLAAMDRTIASPIVQNVRAGIDTAPTQGGPQPEPPTIPPGHTVGVAWDELDTDSVDLQRHLLLRPPQNVHVGLLPLAVDVAGGQWVMPQMVRDALPPGAYGMAFMISDGINSTTLEMPQTFDLCAYSNGGVEICDGLDNDCNGVIDDVAPPAGSALVQVDPVMVSWNPISSAQGYDVVQGDLGVLTGTGGDFKAAIRGCLANDLASTSIVYQDTPPMGAGYFVLIRPVNCGVAGTYDSGSASQVAPRDAGVASSAAACP